MGIQKQCFSRYPSTIQIQQKQTTDRELRWSLSALQITHTHFRVIPERYITTTLSIKSNLCHTNSITLWLLYWSRSPYKTRKSQEWSSPKLAKALQSWATWRRGREARWTTDNVAVVVIFCALLDKSPSFDEDQAKPPIWLFSLHVNTMTMISGVDYHKYLLVSIIENESSLWLWQLANRSEGTVALGRCFDEDFNPVLLEESSGEDESGCRW